MFKKIVKSFIYIFFILFMGCARVKDMIKPNPADFSNVVFDTSYDETWEAIKKTTVNENMPINIDNKELGILETQKVLEFSKEQLFRQYVKIYAEVKKISENFTQVSVNYFITRYDPISHDWQPTSKDFTDSRQKKFLEKLKVTLENS